MAVYTDINEDELSAFLNLYSVGSLLSYRGIAEGIENSNFMLHTDHGTFILTLYEKRVSKNDLPFFLHLMQHLNHKGVVCPQPVLQNNGLMIGELAGRPAAIITFLEGMWMRKPTVQHCREVGKGLAQLHCGGMDFSSTRENSLSIHNLRPLWNSCSEDADELAVGLKSQINQELDFLENACPQNLPTGIIHADLFNDNVFFINDQLSGIIDFYFACNDYLAYDLAICLNAWCFERDLSYNLTKGQKMLENYQSIRKLSKEEIDYLPLLARGAALRFFLTRTYDWFNTPKDSLVVKKDPLEYLRKLNFFRDVSSSFELGF